MGFDPITMAVTISKLIASGQIGKDTSKVYTYNGDMEGRLVIPVSTNTYVVKLSDECPNLSNFKVIKFSEASGMPEIKPGYPSLEIAEGTGENDVLFGAKGTAIAYGGLVIAASISDVLASPIPAPGLYAIHAVNYTDTGDLYVTAIDFGGEVKPIDPKYLPIKEINLDNYGNLSAHIAALLVNGGGSETVSSVGNLWSDVVSDSLVYVKFGIPSIANVTVMGATVLHPLASEHPTQLSFSAAVDFKDDTGVPLNAFVIINYTPSTTELTVKVSALA